MRKKMLIAILIALLAIVGIIATVRIISKIIKEKQKPNKIVFNVSTMKAKKTLLKETIITQSILEGDPQVKVFPDNVSGIFINNIYKEGTYVYKDSVIAYIDRHIPGSDYSAAPIKSPINGIITKLYYQDRGAFVSAQQPVAEVANIDNVKIMVNLGQKDLFMVKQGQPVTITSDYSDGIHISGVINSVTPFIDNDTFSGYATIRLDNKNKNLIIGMTVNIEIQIAERQAYVVPESTVLMGQDKTYIYVNNSGKAKTVEVKTGYSKNGLVELSGNINDDDEIITVGNFKLYENAPVKVLRENPNKS
jgi:multidrug efflux pump subunit AcrA (membrane-fusion protein)